MVQIKLTNHNHSSPYNSALIDIATKQCTLENNQSIHLKDLIETYHFNNPLLQNPYIPSPKCGFKYEYDNLDELLNAAVYVYSILLNVSEPALCEFTIYPSSLFQLLQCTDKVFISIAHTYPAKEQISIIQLENLTKDLLGIEFKFSDSIPIVTSLTLSDLPNLVNGDALFETNGGILQLLITPTQIDHLELRYIAPYIGFGVYSRRPIKKGEVISIYSGKKQYPSQYSEYYFSSKVDTLNLSVDAGVYGNIARFINHAADKPSTPTQIAANIGAKHYAIHDLEVVVYEAQHDIKTGEQLLVDYGNEFCENVKLTQFNLNGTFSDKKAFFPPQGKLRHITIMAKHGVKRPQIYLFIRWNGVLFAILVFLGVIHFAL